LTLESAVAHLNHFCAVLPTAGYGGCLPIYEIDPPDFPEDWHQNSVPQQNNVFHLYPQGPYGATVHLPRHLPKELRVFTTEPTHKTKGGARKFVAFQAYKALYEFPEERFLNEHLLPFSRVDEEQKALLDSGIERRSGLSSVTEQMDPWTSESKSHDWWAFELGINALPDILLLSQRELPDLTVEELPTLYIPGRGAVVISIKPAGKADALGLSIDAARQFTRRLFWRVPGSRLKLEWDNLNFKYLFLPRPQSRDPAWDARWLWVSNGGETAPDDSRVNANAFGKEFDHPTDITFVRASRKREDFRFLQWKFDEVTAKEDEKLRDRYARRGDRELEITYPLMLVKPLGRKDFLIPFPVGSFRKRSDTYENETELLIADHSTVHIASPDHSKHALYLPSILRHLSIAYTVTSFRNTLLVSTPLATLPFELLVTALTAPVAMAHSNYERLETLGDTVLKFMTSIQVMADHPYWHEGYLSLRKDHVVANVTLAKAAVSKGLYRWIIRDRFVPTKWSPQVEVTEVEEPSGEVVIQDKKTEDLSTKMLADVVEALIGAAYVQGQFEMGIECIKLFGMGIEWNPLSMSVESILGKVDPLDDDLPQQMIEHVENMLDYEFTQKNLIVEALTHPSYHMGVRTRPYDRLEFLGDAALDMVVSDYLYRAPGKNYTPGHMYLRKVAIVNLHFLAFACLNCSLTLDASMPGRTRDGDIQVGKEENKIYLWQCLFQSNARVMDDMSLTYARYKKTRSQIEIELKEGSIYPWAALTSLQAPKFFSDIVESLLGAVYLDTHGNMDAVRRTLRVLGIMPVLERIVESDVDVLHPVSRLAQWAAKSRPQKEVRYKFKPDHGRISCTILIRDKEAEDTEMKKQDGDFEEDVPMEEVVRVEAEYRGQVSREEVKFAAAEQAIQLLHLRGEEDVVIGSANET
jgi:endoribonuclease Dicer